MENNNEALDAYIAAIKSSDIYKEYRSALEELKKDPALKRRVDDFRKRNYNFQQSEEVDLAEYDQFRSEVVGFRAAEPRADAFFDAEIALCRLIQDNNFRIVDALDFE